MNVAKQKVITAVLFAGVFASPTPYPAGAAGTPTHMTAGMSAARVAPEPFASRWRQCRGAVHPDYMQDQPLGHENQRVAGLLYTLAAIDWLRAGEVNKALLLASARSHYIEDESCLAHADVWNPRASDDRLRRDTPSAGIWSFLPASVQDWRLPIVRDPQLNYARLTAEPPEFRRNVWDACVADGRPGGMHHFFDRMPSLESAADGFPAGRIPDTTNWSAYDREFYGRWRAECLALKLLDPESVAAASRSDTGGKAPVRFVAPEQFRRVLDDEMANMCASVAAYYRYVSVAARTTLVGEIEAMFPSADRLVLLARRDPHIYLAPDAPWPLKRAAWLLAMELARAGRRDEGILYPAYLKTLRQDAEGLFRTISMPAGEGDRRIVIAWQDAEKNIADLAAEPLAGNRIECRSGKTSEGAILLHGEDLQSAIHEIDYLLDLALAPSSIRP
ncbi:MAG: hypothetical protein M1457_06185, partial [bacterium]|nr:hypothetical protein [bacterium]